MVIFLLGVCFPTEQKLHADSIKIKILELTPHNDLSNTK